MREVGGWKVLQGGEVRKRGHCGNHRVHRVALATFWRTLPPEGKITPAW
jgi:hypothetical protein